MAAGWVRKIAVMERGLVCFIILIGGILMFRWLHIADERNPPPWGRIPLPEDIFGSVLLEKGVIQPNTYERMPSHRFVTSNGLFKLSDPMQRILVSTLLEEIQKS